MPKLKFVPAFTMGRSITETPLQKLEREMLDFSPDYGARRLRSDPLALAIHERIVGELIEGMVR